MMAAGLGRTVGADEEKTRVILDFLVDGGEGSKRCLVVIGAGGSGKTRALHAAMDALPHDVYGGVDVYVWNHGEAPTPLSYRRSVGVPEKWVVFRHGDDALTMGLLEEWVGCGLCGPAVRFLKAQPAQSPVAPTAGPLGTLLDGTYSIRRRSGGGGSGAGADEVFENSMVRITVPVRDDGAALSDLVFGTYGYKVLDDGTERIACGSREFSVPPSAVSPKCGLLRPP